MLFDTKNFNPEVFGQYVSSIPNTNLNELYKSRALKGDKRLTALFGPQTGSYKGTLPYFGRLEGSPDNYDGATDIGTTTPDTFTQQYIVIGRAKGFLEKDFSQDITGGVDFMSRVGSGIAEYWADVYQAGLLSVLKGVFAMTGAGNADFVTAHTSDVSGNATANTFGETTLNTALQKAAGDAKSSFSVAIMHSKVSTDLENLNLMTRLKYTDKNGIQRDLALGSLNGRLVLVDDGMPTETGYFDADENTPGALKVVASGATGAQVNLTDAAPYFGSKTLAANDYVVKETRYTTYVLGEGAITFQDVGAAVPYEMNRAPEKNGGQTMLYTRRRYIIAPDGISFVGDTTSKSPTDAELETGSKWSLMDNGQSGAKKKFYPHKKIAIARILTR